MGESVIVRKDRTYRIEVEAQDPHDDHTTEYLPVDNIGYLTPYGMLLVALAGCTSDVLLSYSEYHDVELESVELHLTYDRFYGEDCKTCEDEHDFEERIDEVIHLFGELSDSDRARLFRVSKQCPIHKMISGGIEVDSRLAAATDLKGE